MLSYYLVKGWVFQMIINDSIGLMIKVNIMDQNPINIKIETYDNKPDYDELQRLYREYFCNNEATFVTDEWWNHPSFHRGHTNAFIFKNGKYFSLYYYSHEATDFETGKLIYDVRLTIMEITNQETITTRLNEIRNDIRKSKEKIIEVDTRNQIRDIESSTEAKIKAYTEKMTKLKDKKIQTVRKLQSKQECDLPNTVESRFKGLWFPKPN